MNFITSTIKNYLFCDSFFFKKDKIKSIKIIVLVFLFSVQPVHGYDFVPSESEWLSWPDYCKARYVTLPIGESSEWAREVSQERIALARKSIGDVFTHVHHYCAGAAWVNRANISFDDAEKKEFYRKAIDEISYVLERVDNSQPIVSSMMIRIAQAYEGSGDSLNAERFYWNSVKFFAEDGSTYASLALFLRKNKRLLEASQVLTEGDAITEGNSVDINIMMAHVLLELGQGRDAVAYAKKAYTMGYPLPNLKEKLIELSLW